MLTRTTLPASNRWLRDHALVAVAPGDQTGVLKHVCRRINAAEGERPCYRDHVPDTDESIKAIPRALSKFPNRSVRIVAVKEIAGHRKT